MRSAALLFLAACGSTRPPAPVEVANHPPAPVASSCGPGHASAVSGRADELAGDYTDAGPAYEESCRQRDGVGCYALGTAYNLGRVGRGDHEHAEKLFAEAAPLLESGCSAGCADTCATLGWTMHTGQGRKAIDEVGAVAMLDKSCRMRSGEGCFLLSQVYMFGYGVTVDESRASELARTSCELGDALGCNTVAFHYGKVNDAPHAREFHTRACKLGLKESCDHLAGVVPDE